ncbi:MAG: hypothetical protein M1814_002609 [Vezdaea aestivalis]|nr:MAG: hypothetical protein M1814_002609 [Vezdaea aestivalis]
MPPKSKGEYIETDSGNKVSRKSQIYGTQNIILGGKSVIQAEVCLRGDLKRTSTDGKSSSDKVAIALGRYCFLSAHCTLRPPSKVYSGAVVYFPLKIGDHVFIGANTIVESANIGSHVEIGERCIIGKFTIIRDFVKILPDTVMPPTMVVPSFSIVAGSPARIVAEMGEAAAEGLDCRERYRSI